MKMRKQTYFLIFETFENFLQDFSFKMQIVKMIKVVEEPSLSIPLGPNCEQPGHV